MDHADKNFDYNQINEHIFIGTNQCCHTHFSEALLGKGVTADISLEKDILDTPLGVEFYLWLPVEDQMPPSPDQLAVGLSFLEKLVDLGKKVYVHCRSGHGRAPTLVAAYFIKQGMTVDQAVNYLIEKRSSVHLKPNQREALEKFHVKVNAGI